MNKDKIVLIVSLVASIVSIIATFYATPMVAGLIFCFAIIVYIAYVLYITYKGVPGNILLRFTPIIFLIIVGGTLYYFWPSELQVCLYHDENNNGLRDEQEKGIHKEYIEILDVNHVSRNLTTNSEGKCNIEPINRGTFRLKTHGVHISGNITRGRNFLSVGIPPKEDNTPPEVRIFLGDEIFVNSEGTSDKKIYAHIWFFDEESDIQKVEIDWGDGWKNVDLTEPNMNFYLLSHKYSAKGRKRVRVKVTNKQGLCSFPKNKPMKLQEDYAFIELN
jgi:energy-coupling factor transporter transmembrane protein EcfT